MIKEPNWKDPIYLAKLIVICNAISSENKIMLELPFYFEKHYNYVKDVFPQFIEQSIPKDIKTQILADDQTHEINIPIKFFNLLIHNFLFEENIHEASHNIEKIFAITKTMQNQENVIDSFVHKLSKYLLRLITFKKSLNVFDGQINYCSLIKIMKGVFKLQEKFNNIGTNLLFFLHLIKFYCVIFLAMHLFEGGMSDVVETNRILNFLRIILNSSMDLQSYLSDFNPDILPKLNVLKDFLILCKDVVSFPQKLNDVNERGQFFNNYKNLAKVLDIFMIIKENNIPDFPKNLIMEKIVLLEPANNLEDSVEIDSKFIAKLDIVFDIHNVKV